MTASRQARRRQVTQPAYLVVVFQRDACGAGEPVSRRDARRVRELRRIGAIQLRRWRLPELIETASVLISELVTNALEHGTGGEISFSVAYREDEVRFEVADGSPDAPVLRCAGPDDESGRGMLLVSALADAWGTSDDRTRTWCVLAVHQETRGIAWSDLHKPSLRGRTEPALLVRPPGRKIAAPEP